MNAVIKWPEGHTDARLYTRAEVAELIGISTVSVVRYAESGLLREHRIPPARGTRSLPRYRRDAIQAFFDSGYLRRASSPKHTHK